MNKIMKNQTLLVSLNSFSGIIIRLFDESNQLIYCNTTSIDGVYPDFYEDIYPFIGKENTQKQVTIYCLNDLELYGFLPISLDDQVFYILIGPVFISTPLMDHLTAYPSFYKHNPSEIKQFIQKIPVLSVNIFVNLIQIIYSAFVKEPIDLDNLANNIINVNVFGSLQKDLENSIFKQREFISSPFCYELELELLNDIKEGNLKKIDPNFINKILLPTRVFTTNPIRQAMYTFVSTTTLVVRAAMQGGVDPETAYNLGDVYIQKADACNQESAINALCFQMIKDFTLRVNQKQNYALYSKPVTRCISYIKNHLHYQITRDTLASYVGLSPSYLSAIFKQETGISLTLFIQKQKINEAKNLLIFTEYSILEISTSLGFSSQSYFQKIFTKLEGVTPKQYRKGFFHSLWGVQPLN